jgi:hypothetical protein
LEGALRIRYDTGNPNAPDDPFGRRLLILERSGAARLGNWSRGGNRAWVGQIEPAAFDAVIAHLEAGGFPGWEPPPIPPSAAFTLTVDADQRRRYSVTDSIYSQNKSYRNALAWLDAVVRQLSGDAIPVGPVRNQRLVLESREADIAAIV